jgi:hypothetical protein
MADNKAAVASGADAGAQGLRQRNVPGAAAPGAIPTQYDEKKIHGQKKVLSPGTNLRPHRFVVASCANTSLLLTAAICPRDSRRMGVSNRTHHLYCPRRLHPIVEDRPQPNCHLGCKCLNSCV